MVMCKICASLVMANRWSKHIMSRLSMMAKSREGMKVVRENEMEPRNPRE